MAEIYSRFINEGSYFTWMMMLLYFEMPSYLEFLFMCCCQIIHVPKYSCFTLMIWCDGKHFRKTRSLRTQNKWYLGEKLHYFPYASFHALQPRNRNWCIFHGIYFGLVSKLLSKHYNVSVWYSRSIDWSMVSLFFNWNRKENEKLIWMSYVSSQFQSILKVPH